MNSWKELSVVIFAASLLVVLGTAQIRQGSDAWKDQVCKENLKRLVQAASLYQADHDGAFQPVIVRTKPSWTYWYNYVVKYAKDPRIFYCPANPKTEKILKADEGAADLLPAIFDPLSQSYGMNFCLSSSGDPKESDRGGNIRRIADPAYTVYFGDSKTASLRPTKWCWKDDYAPIHGECANFVFIDGHAEGMNQKNLGLLHAFDGWNKDVKRWSNWK